MIHFGSSDDSLGTTELIKNQRLRNLFNVFGELQNITTENPVIGTTLTLTILNTY